MSAYWEGLNNFSTIMFKGIDSGMAVNDARLFIRPTSLTIGDGSRDIDYSIRASGDNSTGVLTWSNSQDYWMFEDDVFMSEKIYFADSSEYIEGDGAGNVLINAASLVNLNCVAAYLNCNLLSVGDGAGTDVGLVFTADPNSASITYKGDTGEDYIMFDAPMEVYMSEPEIRLKDSDSEIAVTFASDSSGNLNISCSEDSSTLTTDATTLQFGSGVQFYDPYLSISAYGATANLTLYGAYAMLHTNIDVGIQYDEHLYFLDSGVTNPATDGNFRMRHDGTNLLIEERVSGSWV
jgi:hypothetical protein